MKYYYEVGIICVYVVFLCELILVNHVDVSLCIPEWLKTSKEPGIKEDEAFLANLDQLTEEKKKIQSSSVVHISVLPDTTHKMFIDAANYCLRNNIIAKKK